MDNFNAGFQPYPMLTTPMQMSPPLSSPPIHNSDNTAPNPSSPRLSRLCMESLPASFPRDYYTHPFAPAFFICTWCHSQHIQPTPLASHFPASSVVRRSNVACMFHISRVIRSLWPDALQSGDVSRLLEFMKRRTYTCAAGGGVRRTRNPNLEEIQPCRGHGVGVWACEGVKWFSAARAEDMPGFVACEACYEDMILATPFGSKFVPRVQDEDQSWECDVANKYIKRALLQAGMCSDWEGFVERANMRVDIGLAVASCFGLGREVSSCRWWTLKGYAEGMRGSDAEGVFVICEPCYLDEVGGSRFEGIFEEVVNVDEDEGEAGEGEAWAYHQDSGLERWCSFARNHTVQNAFGAAMSRKLSPDELKEMLEVIASKPRCGGDEGIEGGLFYNFRAGYEVEDFGICEACYVGTMAGFGMQQYLADTPVRHQGKAYCVFHPDHPRAQQFIDRLNEAMDTGNFSIYQQDVRKFHSMPVCPGRDDVENRHWYGWLDCTICPDCFETFARGTVLAKEMPYQAQVLEGPEICSMYSERQRGRYLAACESGNIDQLLSATRDRTAVWHQTLPRMAMLSTEAEFAVAKAEIYQASSHNYAMLNALSFGESTEYISNTGYTYQSYDGVMAEREANESDQLYEEARAIGQSAESIRLEELWAKYE